MSEIQIQSECFKWLWNNYPHTRGLFFHVPNGGSRNALEGMQLKASGVVAGIPDCIFIQPKTSKTYGFEFKTDKGSISPAQQKIHDSWKSAEITVYITRSLNEFKNQITPLL